MDAKQFLNTCNTSVSAWDIDSVVRLAQAQGYRFTANELETAADELWGNLSEEQLRDVVGGGGEGREGKGAVEVDLSNVGGKESAEAWAPPPGDVSGNSCFFTRR
jgi:hypothetical protein